MVRGVAEDLPAAKLPQWFGLQLEGRRLEPLLDALLHRWRRRLVELLAKDVASLAAEPNEAILDAPHETTIVVLGA